MYCPVCRYEYLEEITECSDCRVPLVETLQPEERKPKTPSVRLLKPGALAAIIGMSYVFAIAVLNTIFRDMFVNRYVAGVHSVLILLAQSAVVFFFVCFYREYVQPGQKKLKTAALAVIIAGLVTILPGIIRMVSLVFNTVILPQTSIRLIFTMILSWATAAVSLYFFVVFYKEISPAPAKPLLKKVVLWAAVGAAVVLLRKTLTALFYYFYSTFKWPPFDFSGREIYLILLGIPLVIFPIITMLIFYISFFNEQKYTLSGN